MYVRSWCEAEKSPHHKKWRGLFKTENIAGYLQQSPDVFS